MYEISDPGHGYRWLEAEEFVEATDEVFRPDLNPMWVKPLTRAGRMCGVYNYPVRRSIARTVKVVKSPTACVACGVNWALDGSVSCRECYEYAIEATGCPVESTDKMAAIIAEHTQQVRELTQRIGELVQQVNERDAMIEQIRTALHQDFSV